MSRAATLRRGAGVAGAVLVCDQATKALVRSALERGGVRSALAQAMDDVVE